jgi:hypothetical protein
MSGLKVKLFAAWLALSAVWLLTVLAWPPAASPYFRISPVPVHVCPLKRGVIVRLAPLTLNEDGLSDEYRSYVAGCISGMTRKTLTPADVRRLTAQAALVPPIYILVCAVSALWIFKP